MRNTVIIILIVSVLCATGCSAAVSATAKKEVPKAPLPLTLYADCDENTIFGYVLSGWMGYVRGIELNECWEEDSHSGTSCIKLIFRGKHKWGGIAWQDPPNDWGRDFGGWDLSGAKRVVFWARGEEGGETVEFKMGIIKMGRYPDSGGASLGRVCLKRQWRKFVIPLKDVDLSCIKTAFVVVIHGRNKPEVTVYLDEVGYE